MIFIDFVDFFSFPRYSYIITAKVLITTGDPINKIEKNEIIDLLNPNAKCEPLIDQKVNVSRSSGGLLKNDLFICGGTPHHQDCKILGNITKTIVQASHQLHKFQNWPLESRWPNFIFFTTNYRRF